MNKTHSILAVALVSALAFVSQPATSSLTTSSLTDRPITLFLLRHAETQDTPKRPLSRAGRRRAEALVRLLEKAGVTHAYSSDYPRTRSTVEPLANAAGVPVKLISPQRPKDQVQAIRALAPGSVAVVAGHSNTLPNLIKALGGVITGLDRRGLMSETSHDRLFMMTLSKGASVQTIELQYGDESQQGRATPPKRKVDPADVSIGSVRNERKSTAIFFYSQRGGFEVYGQFELTYGSPVWKASYTNTVKAAKAGTRFRIGDNFFPTFDTSCAVETGSGVLQPGVYYLALERGEGDAISLVFLDPTGIHAKKMNASQANETKGGTKVTLQWGKAANPTEHLEITMDPAAKKGNKVKLSIRFGEHELTTTLRAVLE